MKCGELARHVEAIGRLVEGVGGSGEPAQILCRLLRVKPQLTVAQIAKVLRGHAAAENASQEGRRASEFALATAHSLKGIVKAAVVSDLVTLGDALGKSGGRTVEELVGSIAAGGLQTSRRASSAAAPALDLREHLVVKYHRLLEHALGDDPGFAETYRAIETDGDLRVAELVALAKRFAFASVKSRAAALKKILGRHQALMTSRGKTNATSGRLAG